MADNAKTPRPVFTNIHVTDILKYRLPLAGRVSILHRISGAALFLLMPFVIWLFDTSVTSEISYDQFTALFTAGCAGGLVPGWFFKLIGLGLIWAYVTHFIAGSRHLILEATHSYTKEQGHTSAVISLALSGGLTVVLGAKLFGLF